MKNIITVYDNFFEDPNNVRKTALEQDFYYCNELDNVAVADKEDDDEILEIFKIGTRFPGQRSLLCEEILPDIYNEFNKKISSFMPNDNVKINALFQKQTKDDFRNIHQDGDPSLAGVIYLDNTPAFNTGTCFYKHKKTGWDGTTEIPKDVDTQEWEIKAFQMTHDNLEKHSSIGNKFNRMVMYDANMIHCAEGAEDERLTVVFFVYPGK
tara:strand:- start:224 stop:853 length:630 start_codon:yes stop_codon:yes gene_type:complete